MYYGAMGSWKEDYERRMIRVDLETQEQMLLRTERETNVSLKMEVSPDGTPARILNRSNDLHHAG